MTSTRERSLVDDDIMARGTLCATFRHQVDRAPDRVALRTVSGAPETTWRELGERVDALAAGLVGLGLADGDRMAIMMTNRPEFFTVDLAALHLGVVPTSIYNSLPADEVAFVLGDAGVRVVVTEPAFLDVVLAARSRSGVSATVVLLDDVPGRADTTLAGLARDPDPAALAEVDRRWRAVGSDHVATISYTSGTTGTPKGVVLTHGAVLACLDALDRVIGTIDGACVVAFLPFAHMGGRIFGYYPALAYGFTVSCCADIADVPRYLLDSRPHYLCSPPRLFEKIRGAIEARIARGDAWGERARTAVDAGLALVAAREAGEEPDAELVERWTRERAEVLTPLLATMGLDRVVASLFGSAAVPPHLVRFFLALGLPVLEAWGMTEVVAFGTINRPDDVRVGTVGFPFPGNEVRLAADGEILLRSPWVMQGYLNRPELTAETLVDGWLHTGDVGEFDATGRLRIVDRKKELIISAFGKNMSPANIEFKLKAAHPVIGQVCVIGDGRRYNVALIVIDPEVAAGIAGRTAPPAELAADPAVLATVDRAVSAANETMARVETIKRHRVLDVVWQPGGVEVSPTMKVRRKPVATAYADVIEELYGEAPA